VTLGRPVPLNEAVHLQKPVAADVVQTAFVDSQPAAIYRAQAGPPSADPFFPPPGPAGPAGPSGPPPAVPGPPPFPPGPGAIPACPPPACAPHFWINGEFLFWWVKSAPEPMGGSSSFNVFPGLRLEAGGWFGPAEKWGIEGEGFFLSRNSTGVNANNALPLLPDVIPLGAAANTDSQFYGAEVNGLYNLYRDSNFHAEAIGGFRYLGLQEDLKAYASGVVFLPTIIEAGTGAARLTAQNNFYGGQIGARAGWHINRWFADLTGKVAFGATEEGLTASSTLIGANGTTATFQRRRTQADFAVVPEVNFRVGYDFTRNLHAFVGYDFLYISSVARPGNQNIAGLFGTNPSIHSSDFWAQGINFGLEFTY
jgi:hypothetical protein